MKRVSGRSAMASNMSDSVISCSISHEIHQYLFSSVYILVLLVGIPSNLYSLYHAALQLKQRNELGVYLMNLTVSDLLYLASLPFWLQYFFQISYLCVLRAVGRSVGTQPDQKIRIRQLVSSTILIFLVCFSPYHIFLLVRTLLERNCGFIEAIFNYYHLSLLLTTLNCVADPVLYCFVSESTRHGLYRAVFRPVARILCCCCRRGNASPANPANDSHEVASDENNGQPNVTLLTHSNTLNNTKTEAVCKNTILITQIDEKSIKAQIIKK